MPQIRQAAYRCGAPQRAVKAMLAAASVLMAVAIFASAVISYVMDFDTITAAYAEQPEITLIAKFATYYGDSSENRKHNVALAAKLIDGAVVLPEDEFSFNETVGKRTAERGFRSAYIIQDGVYVEGVGGGVCQVSSTLYNCALLSDLTVTCVHPHSLSVSYVAPSFDAMVSSESDMRFANTLSAPITIRMTADGKYLRAEIYGVSDGASIRRRSETIATIPNRTEYVDDPSLAEGEEIIDTYGHEGIKSEGYLEYYRDGAMVRRVRIRKDTYRPQNRIILRGTPKDANVTTPAPTE